MTRRLMLALAMLISAMAASVASPGSDPLPTLGCIRQSISQPEAGCKRLTQLSRMYGAVPTDHIHAHMKALDSELMQCTDEQLICAAKMFAGVSYINHGLYADAARYLSQARAFSHDIHQRDYIDFLLALSYMGTDRADLAAPYLENIMSYGMDGHRSFQDVLYCESLRIMSQFYTKVGRSDLALRLINKYCEVSDTLVCAGIGNGGYIITDNIQKKYFERRAVSSVPKADGAHQDSGDGSDASNGGLTLALSLVFTAGISGLGYRWYRGRRQMVDAKASAPKKKSAPNYSFGDPAPDMDSMKSFILHNADNAVSVVESSGLLSWVNPGFQKLYGYTREEFILSFGDNVFLASEIDGRYEAFSKCMDTRKSNSIVTKVRTGYNTEIWVRSTITPIVSGGDIVRYVVVDCDVTQLKDETRSVEFVNSQLTASLRNASEIQQLIMPSHKSICEAFRNFVIYSPKNYVSGDFYWFHKIGEEYFLALGDCTGHGPSASLLAMLSSKSLDEIILDHHILDPKDILTALDGSIIESLRQKDDDNNNGLDITICRILPTANGADITVSGAHSYFIYQQGGNTNLLKGAKRSIGGILDFQMKHPFEDAVISLQHGDRFFLTSDGMIDQNNRKRRSLGSRRFCDIIAGSANMTLDLQKEYILRKVADWAEGEPQRDDISLIGIQI